MNGEGAAEGPPPNPKVVFGAASCGSAVGFVIAGIAGVGATVLAGG